MHFTFKAKTELEDGGFIATFSLGEDAGYKTQVCIPKAGYVKDVFCGSALEARNNHKTACKRMGVPFGGNLVIEGG